MNVRALETLLLLFAGLRYCAGFCTHPGSCTQVKPTRGTYNPKYASESLTRRHLSAGDGGNDEDKTHDKKEDENNNFVTWEELQADEELRKLEFDSSIGRKNKMLLPQRISGAVTTLGWAFVIGGIILNSVGYAWVKDPSGGLGVGTLDERNFQRMVIREGRKSNLEEKEKENPSLSLSKMDSSSKHLLSWIEQQRDSQSV